MSLAQQVEELEDEIADLSYQVRSLEENLANSEEAIEEYEDLVIEMAREHTEWMKDPEGFITPELLNAMAELYEMANVSVHFIERTKTSAHI